MRYGLSVLLLLCSLSVVHAQESTTKGDVPSTLITAARDPSLVTTSARRELPRGTLRGQYAYEGEGSCILSPSGFDPVTLQPKGFSFVSSFSVIGIWTFNPDGTSTLTGRVVTTNHSPAGTSTTFLPSAATIDVGARFNVRVFDDDTFHQEVIPGSLFGNYLSGARKGQRFTLDKGTLSGFVLSNRTALAMATPEAELEIQTIFDAAGNVVATIPRYCHASRTLSRLRAPR